MRLGIDFDNTIVCYDGIFHALAVEKGLIPAETDTAKDSVRNYLRLINREDDWTELQGAVYGVGMHLAQPYPGVLNFFRQCVAKEIPIFIVSHKTRYPFRGPPHDLHQAAREWLVRQGFFDEIGLAPENVFFELTKKEKIARIDYLKCTHFIDDLPEIFEDKLFPLSVERLLFDPYRQHETNDNHARVAGWEQISAKLLCEQTPPRTQEMAARALLAALGGDPQTEWLPMKCGGNNRVYSVEGDTGGILIKLYFHSMLDQRDRVGREFRFLEIADKAGVSRLPQPLACDYDAKVALYSMLGGRQPRADEIDEAAVMQAIELVEELNSSAVRSAAQTFVPASEACFSLSAHLRAVGGRLQRLQTVCDETDLHQKVKTLYQARLLPLWEGLRAWVLGQATRLGIDPDTELSDVDRCLSPSDFGYHNALIDDEKKLSFIDFEYAGWDDPAKLIGDFFSQVAVPVPERYFDLFADRLAALTSNPAHHKARFEILLWVYRAKWIAIMLNDFLPAGAQRRKFAQQDGDGQARLANQLKMAQQALSNLESQMISLERMQIGAK